MDRNEYLQLAIKSLIAYQDKITVFLKNTAVYAWTQVWATCFGEISQDLNLAKRDLSMNTAKDTALDERAMEWGIRRDKNIHATSINVIYPWETTILSNPSPKTYAVSNGEKFLAGDTIYLQKALSVGDASPVQEEHVIASKPAEDTIVTIDTPTEAFTLNDLVRQKITVGEGTRILSDEGPIFETLTSVTTGARNPILTGENINFSLADKTYVKCATPGITGNVAIGSINTPETEIRQVYKITNILPGQGGKTQEDDFTLKFRMFNKISSINAETEAFFTALAMESHGEVLRGIIAMGAGINDLYLYLVHRQMATFNSQELAHIRQYILDRIKSEVEVTTVNLTYTAIQISAEISLLRNKSLQEAYNTAANLYADHLDLRKWVKGTAVDSADLLSLLNGITGVENIDNFSPATDVTVTYFPRLTSLKLTDINTGNILSSDLNQGY